MGVHGNSGSLDSSIGGAVPLATWTHCAWVVASTGVFGYINGVLSAGSRPAVGTLYSSTSAMRIANRMDAGDSRVFKGAIDDLRIYNEALTASQIAAIYNNDMGLGRPYPWQPEIVRPTIRPLILRSV
jgi:hypothetical protein